MTLWRLQDVLGHLDRLTTRNGFNVQLVKFDLSFVRGVWASASELESWYVDLASE